MSTSNHKAVPTSTLKNTQSNSSEPSALVGKSARVVLSEDEEEDSNQRYTSDGDDDEPGAEPMSAEALELLKTEKVLKAGYLLKKGEKRRVRLTSIHDGKLIIYVDLEEEMVCLENNQISHV
ncbi:hypothetical protein RMATCC62417_18320 [Rhizopus microsporus]|nr:hypothetical protein RMATCC62417_18320 [Rhizopus microsporus]